MNSAIDALFADYLDKHRDSDEYSAISAVFSRVGGSEAESLSDLLHDAVYSEVRVAFIAGISFGMDIANIRKEC